jgi:hypothetical protein
LVYGSVHSAVTSRLLGLPRRLVGFSFPEQLLSLLRAIFKFHSSLIEGRQLIGNVSQLRNLLLVQHRQNLPGRDSDGVAVFREYPIHCFAELSRVDRSLLSPTCVLPQTVSKIALLLLLVKAVSEMS